MAAFAPSHVVRLLRASLASEATHDGRLAASRALHAKRSAELQLPLWRKQVVEWLQEVSSFAGPPVGRRGRGAGASPPLAACPHCDCNPSIRACGVAAAGRARPRPAPADR